MSENISPTKVGKVIRDNHLSHRLKPVAKILASFFMARQKGVYREAGTSFGYNALFFQEVPLVRSNILRIRNSLKKQSKPEDSSVFANEVKQSNLIKLKLSSDDFNQCKYKTIATFFKMWIRESHATSLCTSVAYLTSNKSKKINGGNK